MNYLTSGRWKLDHSSKLDVLIEPNHTHHILYFLGDKDTHLEPESDGNYILYGGEEALLVVPSLVCTKLLLILQNLFTVRLTV